MTATSDDTGSGLKSFARLNANDQPHVVSALLGVAGGAQEEGRLLV